MFNFHYVMIMYKLYTVENIWYSENSRGLLMVAVKLVWSKFASWNGSLKAHAKKKLFFEKYSIFEIFYFEWIATLFLIGKTDFSPCSISLMVNKNINLYLFLFLYSTYSNVIQCIILITNCYCYNKQTIAISIPFILSKYEITLDLLIQMLLT